MTAMERGVVGEGGGGGRERKRGGERERGREDEYCLHAYPTPPCLVVGLVYLGERMRYPLTSEF